MSAVSAMTTPFAAPACPASLRWALAVSVVAHAVLLAWGDWQLPVLPTVPRAVQVALSGVRPGVAVDNSVVKAVDGAVTPSPAKAQARHTSTPPVPMLARENTPVLTSATAVVSPSGMAAAVTSASATTIATAPAAAGPATSDRSAATSRDSISVDTLSQYRLALGLEARRFKRYPRLARERGWEGRVEIRVQVMANGTVVPVLHRGSSYPVLDEQALEMVERAVRATALPEGLRGRSVQIDLPISFSLTEE